jgi:hypothetical protein
LHNLQLLSEKFTPTTENPEYQFEIRNIKQLWKLCRKFWAILVYQHIELSTIQFKNNWQTSRLGKFKKSYPESKHIQKTLCSISFPQLSKTAENISNRVSQSNMYLSCRDFLFGSFHLKSINKWKKQFSLRMN